MHSLEKRKENAWKPKLLFCIIMENCFIEKCRNLSKNDFRTKVRKKPLLIQSDRQLEEAENREWLMHRVFGVQMQSQNNFVKFW
jgi:hypothetical protein